jgi:hypothetical protein
VKKDEMRECAVALCWVVLLALPEAVLKVALMEDCKVLSKVSLLALKKVEN